MVPRPGEITQLLQLWRNGDVTAESKLFERLLPQLRRMAGGYFRREQAGHTLQPTALVNEAFLRLVAAKKLDWQDRGHFFAIAARIMRRYLIDHARSKPIVILPMDGLQERVPSGQTRRELVAAVDTLLYELAKESPQRSRIVELKFFVGLTDEEGADALSLSTKTFQREWYRARRWLFERLNSQ